MYDLKKQYLIIVSTIIFLTAGIWTGLLTKNQEFESLEIEETKVDAIEGGWLITMLMKNVGKIDAEISMITVNGTVIEEGLGLTNAYGLNITAKSRKEVWIKINNPPFKRETRAIIDIQTKEGNHYVHLLIITNFGLFNI
jgi:hypothetical protein